VYDDRYSDCDINYDEVFIDRNSVLDKLDCL